MGPCCENAGLASHPADMAMLFTTGLLMSAGHCAGMCGPLAATVCGAMRERGRGRGRLAGSLLLYQGGRLASYAAIGAALSLLGSTALAVGRGPRLQGALAAAAGLFMIVLAAGVAGRFAAQRRLDGSAWGRRAGWMLGRALRGRHGPLRDLALGAGNGLLPCGPVLAAAVGVAAGGDPARGALGMAAFGLGTVPLLAALGLGGAWLAAGVRRRLYQGAAVMVALLGGQLLLRGLAALGWVSHLAPGGLVIW